MNHETQVQTPGEELGGKALAEVLTKAHNYCEYETERIALTNNAKITALRAELALLHDEDKKLQERLQRALPPGDLKERRRKAIYYWTVTAFLTVAAFFFSLLAFDPYRLGWKSYLYCLGIAVISPFCVEKFLEAWASPRLMKVLATIACLAALSSLVLLALVRGDVLAQAARDVTSVVSFSDTQAPPAENNFYDRTLVLLRLLMALLALAMEIGAGLALFEARRLGAISGDDPSPIEQAVKAVEATMLSKLEELRRLENQAAVFQNEFWRDFYRALTDGLTRRSLVKISILVFCVVLLIAPRAGAADRLNLVIALDLTKSVAVAAPGQRPEFEKNVEATGQVLARVPANSHVVVLGITDQSFGEPLILFDARIPEDEGYFHERITAARQALVQSWVARTRKLGPQFTHTDIFGALLLASQIFHNAPKGRNVLVIFSDMRENAGSERPGQSRNVHLPLAGATKSRSVPDLANVEVHVLGADNAGKSMGYWAALHDFWSRYFRQAGATLKTYTVLRTPPDGTLH